MDKGTVVKGASGDARDRVVRVGSMVLAAVVVVMGWVAMVTVLEWVAVAPCMEVDVYRAEVDLEGVLYRSEVERGGLSGRRW